MSLDRAKIFVNNVCGEITQIAILKVITLLEIGIIDILSSSENTNNVVNENAKMISDLIELRKRLVRPERYSFSSN
jgi:hypothetical protein